MIRVIINVVGCEEHVIISDHDKAAKMVNAFFDEADLFTGEELHRWARDETFARIGDSHVVFFSMNTNPNQ